MIVAVGMVRDEEDIVEGTLRHLLDQGVDRILVADNLSKDGTREILLRLHDEDPRLVPLEDSDPRYMQAEKMTVLAHIAGEQGAEWIVPFDADERFFVRGGGSVRSFLEEHGPSLDVVECEIYEYLWTPDAQPDGVDPPLVMKVREPYPLFRPKVVFRYSPTAALDNGNHAVSGCGSRVGRGMFLRHYPHRSAKQLLRKIRQGAAALRLAPRVNPGDVWIPQDGLSDERLLEAWEGRSRLGATVEDGPPWDADPPLDPAGQDPTPGTSYRP